MIVNQSTPLHLSYCLNVHPGETFMDQWSAIKHYTARVRSGMGADDQAFGLGLRLGAEAIDELKQPGLVDSFHAWCQKNNYYVFTVNGFPYGAFHDTNIKADVYRPDWTAPERLSYTCAIADVLAQWLPEGVQGSISTVPLWYAPDYPDEKSRATAMQTAVRQLTACADHLETIFQQTGKNIYLALEPEPWCALETCEDVVSFFERDAGPGLKKRIGVCVDTCHCALAFETPESVIRRLMNSGIRISKIQLSAALSADPANVDALDALAQFAEPVYFHQTAQRGGASLKQWPDLPEALAALDRTGEARVHFHVPLQWAGNGPLRSTRNNMDDAFWRLIRSGVCGHLEIETYTFTVLPEVVGLENLTASIESEYRWVLGKMN